MAKAKKQIKSQDSDAERTRLVKVMLSDEEVADVRVAAAIKDLRVSEFARTVALEQAAKVISNRYRGK
jgi:uncharacterized protein (DUF1778 family)